MYQPVAHLGLIVTVEHVSVLLGHNRDAKIQLHSLQSPAALHALEQASQMKCS